MQLIQKFDLQSPPRHIQMQSYYLFIPQMKGMSLMDTKNKMRHIAVTPFFWQNCFTFRLHVFTSICRCFAAQTLPMQFKNSFCYSNVLKQWQQILTGIFENCIFTTSPHSQALISLLSLLSSSLHVFSMLCYSLHNSSHSLTAGRAVTEGRFIINQTKLKLARQIKHAKLQAP